MHTNGAELLILLKILVDFGFQIGNMRIWQILYFMDRRG